MFLPFLIFAAIVSKMKRFPFVTIFIAGFSYYILFNSLNAASNPKSYAYTYFIEKMNGCWKYYHGLASTCLPFVQSMQKKILCYAMSSVFKLFDMGICEGLPSQVQYPLCKCLKTMTN